MVLEQMGWNILSVHFFEMGLRVEQVDVGRATCHEEKDNSFNLGLVMEIPDDSTV